MDEQVIVIKIKTGGPLLVPKHILTAESLKFRELIEELKFEEIEIEDFSTEAVNLFVNFLGLRHLGEIEDAMFREVHKLAVVFEVAWLKESSRDWLKDKMDSATDVESKRFIFDESWYIIDKWGENCMVDRLVSVLAMKDNSTFISDYVLDIFNQLKTGQIDILLKLGGSNTDLFLWIILQNSAGQRGLNQNVTYLLQKMNLALCCERNEELYLKVFETLSNLPEISMADFRLTNQLIIDTVRLVSSRREQRRRRTTSEFNFKESVDLVESCRTLNGIIEAVADGRVMTMFRVVDLLLELYCNDAPSREDAQIFVVTIENILSDKKLQKVSRLLLDDTIVALNYSNLAQSDQMINLLKDIKNNDELSTNHENAIIKRDKVIYVPGNNEYRHLNTFKFKHPGIGTCTESGSECGFIVRISFQGYRVTLTLCTNSEDYSETGIHLHDIISAHEMYFYSTWSGTTPAGTRIAMPVNWLKEQWLSDMTEWDIEDIEAYIAYNIADYLVTKPK